MVLEYKIIKIVGLAITYPTVHPSFFAVTFSAVETISQIAEFYFHVHLRVLTNNIDPK